MTPVYLLPEEPFFPHASDAEPDGLIAIGGDLSPERLINAYAQGIFPWFCEDEEIYWFSPDPRMVFFPGKFRISGSLERTLRSNRFETRFDTCFRDVIEACAKVPRVDQEGTWITSDFIEAYCTLHEAGLAHSVESFLDGKLAGGLYGISLGSAFFGESMFFHIRDASKVAFYHLSEQAKAWNFAFIDCQVETSHLLKLGAELIPREEYLEKLKTALTSPTRKGRWDAV